MRKTMNTVHLEGLLYEHDLSMKVSGPNSKTPNTPFITGTISIATDDDCVNVVPVHFTYVTATTTSGKSNSAYATLQNIIDGVYGTVMGEGKDKAVKLRIDTTIGLNEFYTDRTGKEELVSAKRNEGGFVHVVNEILADEKQRNTFKCDMLITGATRIEADEEKGTSEKVIVKGAVFDFRNSLLPVEFSAVNPAAMDYFEGLEASQRNPVFTNVWGRQINETIVKRIVEESAFGEASVREVRTSHKDFVITGAKTEPYVWDDESSMTVAELNELIAKRETYLATIKQRQDEYKASKNAAATAPAIDNSGFNF